MEAQQAGDNVAEYERDDLGRTSATGIISRRTILGLVPKAGAALLLGALYPMGSGQVSAASCRQLGVYTDYFNGKPAIWIWNGASRPDPSRLTITYNGGTVPSPSDRGVRTDAPQLENSRGWYVYFIATRWYALHWDWNNDRLWRVRYCT